MGAVWKALAASCFVLVMGCSPVQPPLDGGTDAGLDASNDAGQSPADAGIDAGLRVVRLQVLELDGGDGVLQRVELLALEHPGQETAYAQWMPAPAPDGGPRPTLVLTKPYDSISWSGDPRDTSWSAQPAGLFPDRFGPGGADAGLIISAPLTVAGQLGEAGLYRGHGISVLAVYGRFYAGGSIQNDVDDLVAGFEFLAQEPMVDRSRIGIQGGSWGGFLALAGAMHAPASVRPIVGAALYPLSDFDAEHRYVTGTMPARLTTPAGRERHRSFFAPYLLRIEATTGGPPDTGDFSKFNFAALTDRLQTPFFIAHEDWDTLVDFEASSRLHVVRPNLISPLWIRHDAPPPSWDALGSSHGPEMAAFGGVATFTFVWSTLLLRLSDVQAVVVPYDAARFGQLLTWARDRSRAGTRHDELAAQLVTLLEPRVYAYELSTARIEAGAAFVSRVVNETWGLATTAQTIARTLDGGLPP